jgi:uncharacterized DUF497 family protein
MSQGLEWDDANINHIWRRHHVRPHEAEQAADDPRALPVDATDLDERRDAVVGMTVGGLVLVVVFSIRGDRLRVVTPRPANARE